MKETTAFIAVAVIVLAPATAFAATSGHDPMLYFGSVGSSVATLQRDLNADAFPVGNVDGIFGPITLREVRAFQTSENLTVDGIVGPMTWAALLHFNSQSTNNITAIDRAAMHGQVPGLPYASGITNISDIQQAWGQPTSENAAGAGIYDTFSSHNAAFGFNKGGTLFDVRSYAPSLHPITKDDVEKVLGMPGVVHYYDGESILMYPAGPNYQLQWIFSAPTKDSPTPHLDHVSVFDPQATVDSMAATGPAPTLTVDVAPGVGGHLFTFSISQPQSGYAVTELEWIGEDGQTVVNTYEQAVLNGTTGTTPGFEVSGDGQTLSFDYTSAMVNQSGQVRIIEQNSNGTAMIGQSENITCDLAN